MTFGNRFMRWILRSPLHGIISKSFLLISVAGRKSGKQYTVPVNYTRDGQTLTITSYRHRTWWRNVRGGVPVKLWLQGSEVEATADVTEDDATVETDLLELLRSNRRYASAFGVKFDAAGQPTDPERLTDLAHERVVVRVHLN